MRIPVIKWHREKAILFLAIYLTLSVSIYGQTIKVALLLNNQIPVSDAEISAITKLIPDKNILELTIIEKGDPKLKRLHQDFDVVWVHQPNENNGNPSENWIVPILTEYLKNKGNLLLTLYATQLITDLKIETNPPTVKQVDVIDEGYGRKLGMHAFIAHPLFEGMFGGAYLYSPLKDGTTEQTGYFDKNLPANGKVVAVDWAYINLFENSKLAWEYNLEKGKVLCIGAYTHYATQHQDAKPLIEFTRNAIKYLAGKTSAEIINYWDYSQREVIVNKTTNDSYLSDVSGSLNKSFRFQTPALSIFRQYARDEYTEVSGQRIFGLGKERGGIEEIWMHPVMLFRDIEVGIKFDKDTSIRWLSSETPSLTISPESFSRTYKFRRSYLTEKAVASPDKPVIVLHYEHTGMSPVNIYFRLKSNFRFMWPYNHGALGNINVKYAEKGSEVQLTTQGYSAICRWSRNSDSLTAGKITEVFKTNPHWINPETDSLPMAGIFASFKLSMNEQLSLTLSGYSEKEEEKLFADEYSNPESVFDAAHSYYNNLFASKLSIISPDKEFNQGYQWALAATDKCKATTPGTGTSLLAGYGTTAKGWNGNHKINGRPGYAWYFGRDAAWTAFAMLNYGDYETVKQVLQNFEKYQAANGKIYHELTTSGIAHYDAADATPLYIILAGRYFEHTGDTAWLRQSFSKIEKAVEFMYSTDSDSDGLIENTLVGHGWVEGGALFGAHTSLYLASCQAEALLHASRLASQNNERSSGKVLKYRQDGYQVMKLINTKFYDSVNNKYYHGIRKDGSFIQPSLMTTIPLLFKQIPYTWDGSPHHARIDSTLLEYAGNTYTTNWGARILGNDKPKYSPRSYHSGTVWPLFTGWLSLAEYKAQRNSVAFGHLMNNLLLHLPFAAGYTEEVIHGEEFRPTGVCSHQGWSESMVLQPAIEGMLGLEISKKGTDCTFQPNLPAHWDSLTIRNIRVKDQTFDAYMHRSENTITWEFHSNENSGILLHFNQILPYNSYVTNMLVNGKPVLYKEMFTSFGTIFQNNNSMRLSGVDKIEIIYSGGIAMLPVYNRPKSMDMADGLRLIDERGGSDGYQVRLQGKPGMEATFQIYSHSHNYHTSDASLVSRNGKISIYRVKFPESEQSYSNKLIIFR